MVTVERFNLGLLHELEAFFPIRNWRKNFRYVKEINTESLLNLDNLENSPYILFLSNFSVSSLSMTFFFTNSFFISSHFILGITFCVTESVGILLLVYTLSEV